ncbi:hypothetical protein JCM3774_005967 [Rhodotorula dairenensis]
MVPLLSKPTLLFLGFNGLRLLSVVGLCLVFASEIVTIDSDIKAMKTAPQEGDAPTAVVPSATASIKVIRRAWASPLLSPSPDDALATSSPLTSTTTPAAFLRDPPASVSVPKSSTARLVRRHRRHDLAKRGELADGDLPSSTTATRRGPTAATTSSDSSRTTLAPLTATNLPLGSSSVHQQRSQDGEDASSACAYVGGTSIPKGGGGALFATLERIFAALILLLMLFSELCPPFPPLSRPARLVDRFWRSFFPPFSDRYGVGVLGAVEVFVSCQVLSHATTGWIQVSAWFLFIVGILNMLAGLAFGARLKVIRSLASDSTTPSALRRLRLAAASQDEKFRVDDFYGATSTAARAERPGRSAGHAPLSDEASLYLGSVRAGRTVSSPPLDGQDNRVAVEPAEPTEQQPQSTWRKSFLPCSGFNNHGKGSSQNIIKGVAGHKKKKKKGLSASRNGPNGIVISAPIRPVSSPITGPFNPAPGLAASSLSHVPPPPPVYHRAE